MTRYLFMVIMLFSLAACAAGVVLPEGFVLNGIDGLARDTESDGWSFVSDSDLVYLKTTLPAGSSVTILPSGSLEQIRSLARDSKQTRVKIWGILTLYKKKNFLFPIQVIALSEAQSAPAEALPKKRIDPNAIDQAVSNVIPAEIMKIMRSQSKIDLARMNEIMNAGQSNFSLIGKTGYISADGGFFTPDNFGRKIEHGRLPLLPCLTLEETEKKLSKAMGRHRYSTSGIVTTYDGKQYLLMYRAVRTYSNGNFTP